MLDEGTGETASRELPGQYRLPDASICVALPPAYAIARSAASVLDVLARHGVGPLADGRKYRGAPADGFVVASVEPSPREGRPPRHLDLAVCSEKLGEGYAVLPTAEAGRALAAWLEPQAKHGLARLLPDALPLRTGTPYPVLRVYPSAPCAPSDT